MTTNFKVGLQFSSRITKLLDKEENEQAILGICKKSHTVFTDAVYRLIHPQSLGEPDLIGYPSNRKYDITILPVESFYRGIGKDNEIDHHDLEFFIRDYANNIYSLIVRSIEKKKDEENIIIFDLFGFTNFYREDMIFDVHFDVVDYAMLETFVANESSLMSKDILFISPALLFQKVLIREYKNGKEVNKELVDYYDERFILITEFEGGQ